MVADRMAFILNSANELGIFFCFFGDEEKRRAAFLYFEKIEDCRCAKSIGAVIEREENRIAGALNLFQHLKFATQASLREVTTQGLHLKVEAAFGDRTIENSLRS